MFHLGLLRSADAYQALHIRMPLLSALVIHRLIPGYRAFPDDRASEMRDVLA